MPLPRRRARQDVHAFCLVDRAFENNQPQACRYGCVARSPVGPLLLCRIGPRSVAGTLLLAQHVLLPFLFYAHFGSS